MWALFRLDAVSERKQIQSGPRFLTYLLCHLSNCQVALPGILVPGCKWHAK